MFKTQDTSDNLDNQNSQQHLSLQDAIQDKIYLPAIFKKIRGGIFLVIGFLLSPLSWWNDLFFNLPIAYGFGYLCSFFSPNLFLPSAIAGYWLSNILGIILMQTGVMDVLPNQSQERNLNQELLTGLASSTAYTLVILTLIYFKILQTPNLFFGS